ncbi:MAG: ferrochelatase [Burkholderiales bacterium]
MNYRPEPSFEHGSTPRLAILLVNLGTPEAPTFWAVRRYLKQFLSDKRVVEIPRILWWLILNGIILWLRPGASARKYAAIWTAQGSPLRVHSESLATALRKKFELHGGDGPLVEFAMRYGSPSIEAALTRLRSLGAQRILIMPMYPQYAASTTGAVYDAVGDWVRHTRNVPEIRWVKNFHDHPHYINALTRLTKIHWAKHGMPDRLLMSFHGLPRYTLDKGDPYHCECHKTARLLAEALGLEKSQWQISFQSRFGRARWLEPYTSTVLRDWGEAGMRRVDVVCPGFVADCLETLEEIGIEERKTFLDAGGKEFHLLPCLNENEEWIDALLHIATQHMIGWDPPSSDLTEQTRKRALAMGADN